MESTSHASPSVYKVHLRGVTLRGSGAATGEVFARLEALGGRVLSETPHTAPGAECWAAFWQAVVLPDVLTVTVLQHQPGWLYSSDVVIGKCTVDSQGALQMRDVELEPAGVGVVSLEIAPLTAAAAGPRPGPPQFEMVRSLAHDLLLRRRETVRVLSIDGGGVRGIIPSVLLAYLEAVSGRPVHEMFDLVMGTSTGGLVALALTHRREDGTVMSAAELTRLYASKAADIFAHPKSKITGPGYPREDFDNVILNFVSKTAQLSESIIPTVVSTYDLKSKKAHFFKSWRHKVTKYFAAQCTASAPTYFAPPEVPAGCGFDDCIFIDGGVVANNPALKAYLCAKDELYDGLAKDFLVVSLGTGCQPQSESKLTREQVGSWGLLGWIRPDLGDLTELLMDISSDVADMHMQELMGRRYRRFQKTLEVAALDMDNATPKNIAALLDEGAMIVGHEEKIKDNIIQRIVESK